MSLVNILARAPGPISLTRLAEQADLHTASAHRILGALMAHGLVEKTGAGEYDLGVRWLEVGNRLRARMNIRQMAMPYMQKLAELTGETVNLIVRRGDEAVYIERVSGGQTLIQVVQVVGAHAPLHVTAVGKIFLAEDSASGVMGYAERTGLPAYTPNTLITLERLRAELETIRVEKIAHDREEAELGVACIGAPIRDAEGKLVAGLSIFGLRPVATSPAGQRRLSTPLSRPVLRWVICQRFERSVLGCVVGLVALNKDSADRLVEALG